jgi:hypothetical protein
MTAWLATGTQVYICHLPEKNAISLCLIIEKKKCAIAIANEL